jgi:2-polyprenyl-6-methoxyphenol hydroxylase-like FAD-dependent oxidoreductase
MKSPAVGCDVVIAGTGIAACAVAARLLDAGHRPLLLGSGIAQPRGAEILPPDAHTQIDALGWRAVLRAAGALSIEGFENHWDIQRPAVKRGGFLHVDRRALADAALAHVVERGAVVVGCRPLPPLQPISEGVETLVECTRRRFIAALDATGRAAAWSRPVRRFGRLVADVFEVEGPPGTSPLRGRVVATGAGRWAYRVGLRDCTTIGVVAPAAAAQRSLDLEVRQRLAVPDGAAAFVACRSASPQWSTEPALRHRLAVGDAAFASDPIAGQGIRFALASAIAAAAVVCTLTGQDDGRAELALEYYRDFVDSARDRHLRFLARLDNGLESPQPAGALPRTLQFRANARTTGLNIDGVIVPGIAVDLPDGGSVRWLGTFDLLILRELAQDPVSSDSLVRSLRDHGLTGSETELLLRWCLARGILGEPTALPRSPVGD